MNFIETGNRSSIGRGPWKGFEIDLGMTHNCVRVLQYSSNSRLAYFLLVIAFDMADKTKQK